MHWLSHDTFGLYLVTIDDFKLTSDKLKGILLPDVPKGISLIHEKKTFVNRH